MGAGRDDIRNFTHLGYEVSGRTTVWDNLWRDASRGWPQTSDAFYFPAPGTFCWPAIVVVSSSLIDFDSASQFREIYISLSETCARVRRADTRTQFCLPRGSLKLVLTMWRYRGRTKEYSSFLCKSPRVYIKCYRDWTEGSLYPSLFVKELSCNYQRNVVPAEY